MADSQTDFPTLDTQSGITDREKEEIRQAIETVATENRIPVEAAQFSLPGARRGLLLPGIVNAGALAAIGIAVLVLTLVFRQGEHRVQTQATQYASVEGQLIRELRQESRQALGAKEKEIEEVKGKLRELERQQAVLEQTFGEKLKAKEEEFRSLLKQELDKERARLAAQGVGQADMDVRLRKFESERRAYYDRQLAAYRKQLEAERAQVQADISRLRSEYSNRLEQLEKERRTIVAEYEKREATLRVQLEQKTQVMDRLRAQSAVDLEAAQRQLGVLGRQQEQVRSVENQIEGQVARVREAVTQGDTAGALTRVRALQDFLRQDTVRSVPQLTDRVRAESFLLGQLGTLLEERLEAEEAAASGESLAGDLELLAQVRKLADEAAASKTDQARLDAYRRLVGAVPEVRAAAAALLKDAAVQALSDDRRKTRAEAETAAAAAVAAMQAGNYAAALDRYAAAIGASPDLAPDSRRLVSDLLAVGFHLTSYVRTGQEDAATAAIAARTRVDLEGMRQAFKKDIEQAIAARELELLTQTDQQRATAEQRVLAAAQAREKSLTAELAAANDRIKQLDAERAQAEARQQAERVKELDVLAARARTTRQDLNKRIDALIAFEDQVKALRASYARYTDQDKAARQANPNDLTASRNELDKFLRDDPVKAVFANLVDQVGALYTATENAGSSVALSNAAEIIEAAAKQPSIQKSRQYLANELSDAQMNDRLKAILTAVDAVLAKAQAGAQ
jgi:hypothetical protein